MMPPICGLCGNDFRHDLENEGGLIYFAKTASDLEWHKRAAQPGFTGHPPEAVWFCGEHYADAKKLTSLTKPEAMQKMHEIFGPKEG